MRSQKPFPILIISKNVLSPIAAVHQGSSYADYLKPGSQRPSWLRVDRLLGVKRIPRDSAAGRREFAKDMEGRRAEDLSSEFKPVERGWGPGSEKFRRIRLPW